MTHNVKCMQCGNTEQFPPELMWKKCSVCEYIIQDNRKSVVDYKVLDEHDGDAVEPWVAEVSEERNMHCPGCLTAWNGKEFGLCPICHPIKKVNHGKPDLSRILDAPLAMEGIAIAFEEGEDKDGRTRLSWQQYNDPDGLVSALMRHLVAYQNGEWTDPDSKFGLSHLQKVVVNAVMLVETVKNPSISDGELATNKR